MYEQHIQEDILFCMFYAVGAVLPLIASIYLLLRRGNAFSLDITPPLRLRRWTSAFFTSLAFSHVWYSPIIYLTDIEDIKQCYRIGGLLDCVTLFPLGVIVLLTMLQDRRRPLWPIGVTVVPFAVGMAVRVVRGSDEMTPVLYTYLLLSAVGFIIYMVRELRQYGRWLRDNYADLEHKEVRQSFVVIAVILILFGIYVTDSVGPFYFYVIQMAEMLAVCFLLWRVETLSDLSALQQSTTATDGDTTSTSPAENEESLPPGAHDKITPLLQERCIDAQLYLQHDLTLQQLAKAIGINRYYLSQYFSGRGTTYNAYINDLRIRHFVGLYSETVGKGKDVTAQQLANDSGYHSYSTFSLAFKQRMGQTVTEWMRNASEK